MLPHRFGRLLRKIREENGWTQEEMAERLGISRQALFLLETGRGFPSFPLAMRIAKLINGKEVNMFGRDFDPFNELERLHRELDRMFNSSFGSRRSGGDWGKDEFPAVNLRETDQDVMVEATLPGLTSEDVQINVTENELTLKGKRKSEEQVEDKDFVRREYSYGSFARAIAFPTAVKPEEAQANLKNGLLTIRVPKKAADKPQGRELTINEE